MWAMCFVWFSDWGFGFVAGGLGFLFFGVCFVYVFVLGVGVWLGVLGLGVGVRAMCCLGFWVWGLVLLAWVLVF